MAVVPLVGSQKSVQFLPIPSAETRLPRTLQDRLTVSGSDGHVLVELVLAGDHVRERDSNAASRWN